MGGGDGQRMLRTHVSCDDVARHLLPTVVGLGVYSISATREEHSLSLELACFRDDWTPHASCARPVKRVVLSGDKSAVCERASLNIPPPPTPTYM